MKLFTADADAIV